MDKQTTIKSIIFDFGGVIINISHEKLEAAFKMLGIHDFENLFNQANQSELFQQFEIGQISPNEFRIEVKKITGINIEDDLLDDTWNQIIGDYPKQRIDLLKAIKSRYKLFLLSNTNKIHYDYYINKFRVEFGFDFQSLFHNTYWSFKMGKRKPDPEAYYEVLNNEKLVPAETIFIDDSKQNIYAAESLGLKSIHLNNKMELTELFNGSILIIER